MRTAPDKKPAPPAAAPPAPARHPAWWAHALLLAGLMAANLALYHGTFHLGFLTVDDPDYVQNNPYIERLSATNLHQIFTQPYAANYAPANLLSYALDVALGGRNARAFHTSSVFWHGWVVCMVYLLALAIRPNLLLAAIAASLFLLHPTHVEVVAWISSRKDLVATGFALPAMAAWLLYRRHRATEAAAAAGTARPNDKPPPPPRWRPTRSSGWYLASVCCFLVACAAKQSVLLLPAVMLGWDLLVERRRTWTLIADKIPFGLIALFFGWMTWHAQPGTNQAASAFVPPATQWTNRWLLGGLGEYVLYRATPNPAAWNLILRWLVLAGAVAVWILPWLLVRRGRAVWALLCWWALIQMLPPMFLNFIVPVTDRYLFLPSVGVCLLLPLVAAELATRSARARWVAWPVLALLGLVWGAKTWTCLGEWQDPRSVWYGAHFKTPNSQVAQFLGEVYHAAGDRMDGFIKTGAGLDVPAEVKFAAAVLRDPGRVRTLESEWHKQAKGPVQTLAYRNLLWSLAWEQYQGAVARRGTLSAPNLFLNRGRLLVSEGNPQAAIGEFQTALRFAETSNYQLVRQETVVHALRSLAVACWHQQNFRAAQEWYVKAQAVQRKSGKVWVPTLDQELARAKQLADATEAKGGRK